MVPRSRSRVTAIAVIMTMVMVRMVPIRPGTMLYSVAPRGCSGGFRAASSASALPVATGSVASSISLAQKFGGEGQPGNGESWRFKNRAYPSPTLCRLDFVILDELGYLPFAQTRLRVDHASAPHLILTSPHPGSLLQADLGSRTRAD